MRTKKRLPDFIQPLLMKKASHRPLAKLKRFKLEQISTRLTSELQLEDIQAFQLGDSILTFTTPLSTESLLVDRQNDSDCYLVCDGRIRLLCHNVHLDRLVPATVLEVGDIFGADHLFCSTPLPYQAIASTACRVARIPASQLTLLLEQRPQFWQHLSALAQQRERLIFFKSLTQMRSYPSQVLKQSLLPQLIEHRVCAGEYLATATPETAGYFWLRRGQVYSESYRSLPPVVGDGWGYPNPVPDDWVAETDLLLYKLLLDAWETADLLQAL